MAMLRTVSNNQLIVSCGGTVISSRYVLTAAPCLRTIQGEINIDSVVLEEHDTNTNPDCIDGVECADPIQEIAVERSIPHPNFKMAKGQNDIGLVRLQWNALFSDSVMPICIPYTPECQASDYKRVIVTGWGGTEYGDSNVLLKAVLDVIPNRECSTIYERYYFGRIQINENILCAFGGYSDICGGDSGDPATFIVPISKFGPRVFQFGVASAGARICGMNKGIPGLYTRVTSYALWILDNISE